MKKLTHSRNLIVALVAVASLIALESTASAWPVNRFYRTGSTNTVVNALRNSECNRQVVPASPVIEQARRQPVSRFYPSHSSQPRATHTARPRFFMFDLFR
ncbi:MAG: hypothetical protein ACI8P0_001628 [Planctomycetaceae bacterium]|jgi:hypothetical protein